MSTKGKFVYQGCCMPARFWVIDPLANNKEVINLVCVPVTMSQSSPLLPTHDIIGYADVVLCQNGDFHATAVLDQPIPEGMRWAGQVVTSNETVGVYQIVITSDHYDLCVAELIESGDSSPC